MQIFDGWFALVSSEFRLTACWLHQICSKHVHEEGPASLHGDAAG